MGGVVAHRWPDGPGGRENSRRPPGDRGYSVCSSRNASSLSFGGADNYVIHDVRQALVRRLTRPSGNALRPMTHSQKLAPRERWSAERTDPLSHPALRVCDSSVMR